MKNLFYVLSTRARLVAGLALGLLGTGAAAQAQTSPAYDWSWATQLGPSAGSNRTAFVHGLAADAAGNVTIGGEFDPDLYFANSSTGLQTNRQPDTFGYTGTNGFLAQYQPNGQLAWTLNLPSNGAQVADVATDATGNIYALGYRSRSLNFGSGVVLATPTLARAFLVKLSAAGVPQWAIDVANAPNGVKESYFIWQLAADAAGNCVVQGTYSGSLTIAGQTYTAPAGSYTNQPFLVRVSAAGAVTGSWGGQQTQGDNVNRSYTGLALAPTGEVYLAGAVSGAVLQFGSLPPVTSPATATRPAGFLLKISAANAAEWVLVGNAATATTYNSFNDVKVSASGHIYALGAAVGPFTLGTQVVPNTNNGTSFVARIAPNGTIRRSATGTSSPQNLALGPHEDLYIGTYNGPVSWGSVQLAAPASPNDQLVSVVRLDSTGQALQGWRATGPAIIREPRLAVDGLGQASVAAWLYGTGTFSFGSKPATAANPWGMFVARTGMQVLAGRSAQPVAGLTLYPNPARQSATIGLALAAPASAQVLDALGRLASTQALPAGGQLDLRGLAPGPYVVRVQQGEAVSYRHLAVLPQ
ncbi:MAG: T9SS type A sorting domain-containing protein [Hymenobacter sp.]|nr:MAG: T9SS type A sorting domain-containing protein [Hymenobacter sp.]